VVDLVVDAAQEKESVVVWEMYRVKPLKCPIQECANGGAHTRPWMPFPSL
jgi:hypothetical protein